jgi:hypothetical protein
MGGLVVNEISGKDPDYVELFNTGTTPIDLSGYGVTEAKNDDAGVPGTPKTPAVFASGSTLGPGEYAVAIGAPKDGGVVFPMCPATVCVQASWDISATNGAAITVLDPNGAVVLTGAVPGGVEESGDSWGRLPNGTGTFQLNGQTPGAANKAPESM